MDAIPDARWGTVAAAVMRRTGLSVAAKAVYSDMATYADRHGWVWVRQETIAADLDRSRAWVHAALVELEGQGLICHERQFIEGRQRASRYRLLDGLVRGAATLKDRLENQDMPVSAGSDSAVQPADTTQHEGFRESLSAASAREPGSQSVQVPEDWVPSSDDVSWARSRHPRLDVLAYTETFILSCRAKGYRYTDISAAWRRWLAEPKGKLPLLQMPTATASNPEDRRHDRNSHQQRRSASPVAQQSALLAANREAENRALERILARRAGHHAAGHPG